ncbi:MAG: Hsp20/alpha crystallin family protein [Magnetococcales bacterium]|nr:Hsp20/alpha crystallin family protein [Magnetococcales bacterium]
MAIVQYDPFQGIRGLQQEINRLFDRDFEPAAGLASEWAPRVDIREENDKLVLSADLPGMEQKEISVHVENGYLSLSGERKMDKEVKKENYHRVERVFGRFSRTFQLPSSTDVEHIQASYRNGVLEIVLPKKEQAKPRAIAVTIQ